MCIAIYATQAGPHSYSYVAITAMQICNLINVILLATKSKLTDYSLLFTLSLLVVLELFMAERFLLGPAKFVFELATAVSGR